MTLNANLRKLILRCLEHLQARLDQHYYEKYIIQYKVKLIPYHYVGKLNLDLIILLAQGTSKTNMLNLIFVKKLVLNERFHL